MMLSFTIPISICIVVMLLEHVQFAQTFIAVNIVSPEYYLELLKKFQF